MPILQKVNGSMVRCCCATATAILCVLIGEMYIAIWYSYIHTFIALYAQNKTKNRN